VIDFLARVVDPAAGRKLVVPGYDARAWLEADLVAVFPTLEILATDYPSGAGGRGAAASSSRQVRRPGPWRAGVGTGVRRRGVTNSVLSDSDVDS